MPESVTHVLGMKCHPSLRKGRNSNLCVIFEVEIAIKFARETDRVGMV